MSLVTSGKTVVQTAECHIRPIIRMPPLHERVALALNLDCTIHHNESVDRKHKAAAAAPKRQQPLRGGPRPRRTPRAAHAASPRAPRCRAVAQGPPSAPRCRVVPCTAAATLRVGRGQPPRRRTALLLYQSGLVCTLFIMIAACCGTK